MAEASVFSMASAPGSRACVTAERVASGTSRAASAGSVMTGTLCGPRTSGRMISEVHCGGPIRTGDAAQMAVLRSWQTTRSTGGSLYFS